MTARTKRLSIMRGDDVDIIVRVKLRDGTPYDLSGCRVDFTAKLKITDESPVLSLSSKSGEIKVLDDGVIAISIPHEKTENQTWKEAFYDLQLTAEDGKIKTILRGSIELIHDITEAENE